MQLNFHGPQNFEITAGSTTSSNSGGCRVAYLAKKAELASASEARLQAKLEAMEADEVCSKISHDSRSQLPDALHLIGLGSEQHDDIGDRRQDDTNASPGGVAVAHPRTDH